MRTIDIDVVIYSLIPPERTSFRKYFFSAKKIPITGSEQITEKALKAPHCVISRKLPLNSANPRGSVRKDSEFVTISGHIKLFQVVIKVKIARVVIAGKANGIAIL